MPQTLVLASGSAIRKTLLANAGVAVQAVPADLDERAVEAALADTGATPEDLALVLAEAKACSVSETMPDALVIGADQILSLNDEVLHKVADMESARRRLLQLSGRTHRLTCGVALARNGETLWRHASVADLTMRALAPEFVGRHLARAGADVLASVGAYQIEGEGIQLFDRIDGDMFTVMGLPLLPLLDQLRQLGALDG